MNRLMTQHLGNAQAGGDIAKDFPALDQSVHGHRIVYLDNAATTQKPETVIEALANYYRRDNANVHRGVHTLSERATAGYELAREKVAQFLGATSSSEIVFVRGATEGINLIAYSWGASNLHSGDEILLTELEHHSNIVPWQLLCQRTGARIVVAPIDDRGVVSLESYAQRLSKRTRLVGISHVSNALGTINPVQEMTRMAHEAGATVLIDGAQSVAHMPVNVGALDCDFYVLSGHKMYAPMGIGAIYARASILETMPPWQGGGDMIRRVRFAESTYAEPPQRFEAGTPNVGGAIALGSAIDYLAELGMETVYTHEQQLLDYALDRLAEIPGLRIVGQPAQRSCVISFWLDQLHPHDLGTVLDHSGVAIRTGHHCAMPVMDHFDLPATARLSLGIYNSKADIDLLIAALLKAKELFTS